jgi:tetratricopeptide (TPR) repeat protein
MRDALTMASTLGDVQRGELLLLGSWHYYLCMRRREQADACRQASELLRPTRDLAKLGEALVNLQMACIQIGRPRDVARTEEETRTLAERLGRFDIKVLRWYSEAQRDWMLDADLDRLDVWLGRVAEVAGAWRWLAEGSQAQALLWRGNLEAAHEQARVSLGNEPPIGTLTGIGWAMVFLCDCSAGHREAALSRLAERSAGLPRPGRLNTLGSWTALFKVIEGLAILGEREAAAAFYPLVVEALAIETVVTFDASHLLETVAGIAAAAGGQWDVAERHYRTAMRQADEMPFISEQAEARYWYARMRIERDGPGDRDQARALLHAALKVYRKIGMPWHIDRTEALI